MDTLSEREDITQNLDFKGKSEGGGTIKSVGNTVSKPRVPFPAL